MRKEIEDGTMLADGFEKALVGFGWQFNRELAIYDYDKCVEILMERDEMDRDDAIEFMEFNVLGAWVGEGTPVFLHMRSEADDD
jgi:hypothetical protein